MILLYSGQQAAIYGYYGHTVLTNMKRLSYHSRSAAGC